MGGSDSSQGASWCFSKSVPGEGIPRVLHTCKHWGSVDSSGYKELQQQLQHGLGQGNGWEKPVHREGKKKERKKSMGRIEMTSYHHYYIISSARLIYYLGNHSPSAPTGLSLVSPVLFTPELPKSNSWVKKQRLGPFWAL